VPRLLLRSSVVGEALRGSSWSVGTPPTRPSGSSRRQADRQGRDQVPAGSGWVATA